MGNKHWLPPIHSRSAEDVEDHYVYLSTPSEREFVVTLKSGNMVATATISAENPVRIAVGNSKPSPMFTDDSELNSPSFEKGITLTGSEEFYTSFRVRSLAQAGYLTTKGEAALGTSFRLGSLPQVSNIEDKNFFTSLMATEDNTVVTISDFDDEVVFAGPNAPTEGIVSFVLNAEESYTLSGYMTYKPNYNGFIGALVTSDKPIVVNTGNALGGFEYNKRDYTIDQIVPISEIGDEYIIVEGNGTSLTERPMVIATEADTEVFVNGNSYATIANAGEYLLIENSQYQGATHRNMYIATSKNVYLYQFLAGDSNEATLGMNFIPPLSCFFQKEVDLIPEVDKIGNSTYEGDIIAVTRKGATVLINGKVTPRIPEDVLGNPDWVTHRFRGYRGSVAITSTDPISVGIFGYNGDAGFAGYYSGFGAVPKDTEIDACDFVLTDLLGEINGNPEPGGAWTDPQGSPHDGIFDPLSDAIGSYNYYLETICETIDVNVNVMNIVMAKNPGRDNSLDVCENEEPFDLFPKLLGMPETGGEWRNSDGIVFDGIFNPARSKAGIYSYGFYGNPPCDALEAFITIKTFDIPERIEAVLLTPVFAANSSSIEVLTIKGDGAYQYQIDDGPWQNTHVFEEVPNGKHIINLRDQYGCGSFLSDTIRTLSYPTFFTPNGDGVNDTWNIEGLDDSYTPEIFIFDKYGKLIKRIDSNGEGWDGSYQNNEIASGDYWFQIFYTEDGANRAFKSHFALKR